MDQERLTKKQKDVHQQNQFMTSDVPQSTAKNANVPGTGIAPEIYANDEIEFLLDEIRDLEVPAFQNDAEQDFDIAGSRADLDLTLQLDSPMESSW